MNFARSLRAPLLLVTAFWMVECYELVSGDNLSFLGILPRSVEGLAGIFCAPFLHSGFSHLFSNSTTFLLLGASMRYFYPVATKKAFPYLYLLTGLGVWFLGRGSVNGGQAVYHIGASGLVYAFASFLFFGGVFRKDRRSWAISFSVALIYHGLLYSIVPSQPGISWESHLSGFLVGLGCAFVFRNDDALLERREPELPEADGYRPLENKAFKYTYVEKHSSNSAHEGN